MLIAIPRRVENSGKRRRGASIARCYWFMICASEREREMIKWWSASSSDCVGLIKNLIFVSLLSAIVHIRHFDIFTIRKLFYFSHKSLLKWAMLLFDARARTELSYNSTSIIIINYSLMLAAPLLPLQSLDMWQAQSIFYSRFHRIRTSSHKPCWLNGSFISLFPPK